MQDLLACQELHPDEAGRMIVDRAAQRRFWSATHPEMLQGSATARAEHLSGLLGPRLQFISGSYRGGLNLSEELYDLGPGIRRDERVGQLDRVLR